MAPLAFLLLMVVSVPGQPVEARSMQVESMAACRKAGAAFLAGPPDAHAIREPDFTRSILCVTVSARGRDA